MYRKINVMEHASDLIKKLQDLGNATHGRSLSVTMLDLVNIRASQLNGCAFCLDMHVKEAKLHGERELRLYHVPVWRDSTLFSDKERACLEWTESVTQLDGYAIPEDVYNSVRQHLSEKELTDLTFAIGVINFFNRINLSFPKDPGSMDEYLGLSKSGLE